MTKRETTPTRAQLLVPRGQSAAFTGREAQLAHFQNNLNRPLEDRKLIWMVSGQGGFGKTTLLGKYREFCKNKHYAVAWVDRGDRSVVPTVPIVMDAVAGQLVEQGCDLAAFRRKYASERSRLQDLLSGRPDRLTHLAHGGGRVFDAALHDFVPGGEFANTLLKESGGDTIGGALGRRAPGLLRVVESIVDQPSAVQDIVASLSRVFVDNLSEAAAGRPIALFLDEYESLGDYIDDWLIRMLSNEYGDLSPNVLLVIAGRKPLTAVWFHYQRAILQPSELDPFTPDEAMQYLDSRGIDDPARREIILSTSKRIPMLMNLLCRPAPAGASALIDPTDEAIDVFLKWVPSGQRDIFLACAVPRYFDTDTLAVLIGEERANAAFDLVKDESFVSRQVGDAGWRYHDLIRELVLTHLRHKSRARWNSLNDRLATYHTRVRDENTDPYPRRYYNEAWRRHDLEWFYHTTCLNGRDIKPDLVARLLSCNEWSSPNKYDIGIGEAVEQAGHVLEDPELESWGRTVASGINGYYIEDDAAAILPLLDFLVMNSAPLSPTLHAHARCWRGRLRSKRGETEMAGLDFAEAEHSQPWSAPCYFMRGLARDEQKDFAGADADFTEAIRLQPEDANNYHQRAHARLFLNNVDGAMDDFRDAIHLQPENASHYKCRGSARYEQEDYPAAEADFSEAIRLQPEDGYNYYWRGRARYQQKDFAAAEADFSEAIRLQPENGVNYHNRGRTRYKQQDYPAAEADFSEAIRLQPENGVNYHNRGRVRYEQEDYPAAEADFSEAISRQPENGDNYYWRGLARYEQKDYPAAEADFSEAIRLQPEDGDNYYWRGLARYEQEDYPAAEADFSEAIRLQPEDAYDYARRGKLHLTTGDVARAEADFARVRELANEIGRPYYIVAGAYAALALVQPACEYLELAFERDSKLVTDALTDKEFDPIRDDARFLALADRYQPGKQD